jgi:hypothetical protein
MTGVQAMRCCLSGSAAAANIFFVAAPIASTHWLTVSCEKDGA